MGLSLSNSEENAWWAASWDCAVTHTAKIKSSEDARFMAKASAFFMYLALAEYASA